MPSCKHASPYFFLHFLDPSNQKQIITEYPQSRKININVSISSGMNNGDLPFYLGKWSTGNVFPPAVCTIAIELFKIPSRTPLSRAGSIKAQNLIQHGKALHKSFSYRHDNQALTHEDKVELLVDSATDSFFQTRERIFGLFIAWITPRKKFSVFFPRHSSWIDQCNRVEYRIQLLR